MPRTIVKTLFKVSFVVALTTLGALAVIDLDLRGPASPAGIVSFEVCAFRGSCGAILESWGATAKLMAALSLGLDYLFMVAYPATIFLGLLLTVEYLPPRLRRFTTGVAWLAWAAGVADAFENYFLARMLIAPAMQQYAWPAAIAATVKFIVLGGALSWLLWVCLRYVIGRKKPAARA